MVPIRKKEGVTDSDSQKEDASWKLAAEHRQKENCDLVIDYDWLSFKNKERYYLEKKVKLVIYGDSEDYPDKESREVVKNICKKIVEGGNKLSDKNEVYMAYIYIIWTNNGSEIRSWPVFKVPKNGNIADAIFIDIYSRVYEDWDSFLKKNKFPPCEYCYPKDGEYTIDEDNRVVLEYGSSPASSLSNKVVKYLDYSNSALGVGTTVVTAASLFLPVSAPLLQASLWLTKGICAYSSVRCGTTLYDRGAHKQSVGLGDPESRSCWLSIGSSAVGAAASSATLATQKMAQAGQVAGRFVCAGTTALNVSNVAVNGVGLLNNFMFLHDKYLKKELSSLDVLQFSASLLLFAHAAVNVQTAKSIIEDAQNNVLQDFESNLRSNRHRRMFRKVAKNTRGQENTIEGNAKVIRALKHIDNVDDFFAALARMDKQFRSMKSKVGLGEGGNIQVNDNYFVDPTQLVSLTVEDRKVLLEATKRYGNNEISETRFRSMTHELLGDIPTTSSDKPRNMPKLWELLRLKYWKAKFMRGPEITFSYPALSAYERTELMVVLKLFAESDHEQILNLAGALFRALNCTSGLQFVESAYFICGFIKNLTKIDMLGTNDKDKCDVSARMYGQAELREVLRDPSILVEIFNHVKEFMQVFSQRNTIPTEFSLPTLFEFAQIPEILLQMDKPLWIRCLECAEKLMHMIGWRKPEMLIRIVKNLFMFLDRSVKDMKRKQRSSSTFPEEEYLRDESSHLPSTVDYNQILHTLSSDTEIQESFLEQINKINSSASNMFEPLNVTPKFTRIQPLEVPKQFWIGDHLTLLSEEEIMDICKRVLELEDWPADCNVEYEGCDVSVNIDNKLITIKCHVDQEKICAFVECVANLY